MRIGLQIKRFREAKNYTQAWMAEQLDMSQKAFSKIENNESSLSVEKLQRIAELLEINVSDFFENNGKHIYNNIETQRKGGNSFVINQAEKAMELYEKLVAEKDARILSNEKLIIELTKKTEGLELQLKLSKKH